MGCARGAATLDVPTPSSSVQGEVQLIYDCASGVGVALRSVLSAMSARLVLATPVFLAGTGSLASSVAYRLRPCLSCLARFSRNH